MSRSHLPDADTERLGTRTIEQAQRSQDPLFIAETLGSGAREWWPTQLARHGGPEGRQTPADWIVTDRARRFFLDAFSPAGERPRLAVGSTVPFVWRECRAAIEMTVEPDGSYEPHGSVPRDATHFWDICDSGMVARSLEELAMFYADGLAAPTRLRVRMCRWSRTETIFRLHLAGGRPILLPADEAQRLAS